MLEVRAILTKLSLNSCQKIRRNFDFYSFNTYRLESRTNFDRIPDQYCVAGVPNRSDEQIMVQVTQSVVRKSLSTFGPYKDQLGTQILKNKHKFLDQK